MYHFALCKAYRRLVVPPCVCRLPLDALLIEVIRETERQKEER
jgi:hypothetical protein